jgi:hypothetical protein
MIRWSVVAAVNNERVLENSLLRSPDLAQGAVEVILKRGYRSASAAYNAALAQCSGDVVVFVHQDVYLPAGWFDRLQAYIDQLARSAPAWGVLGLCGVDLTGEIRGHVYSTGLRSVVGAPLPAPVPVNTLDEMVLVIRRQSGLMFDGRLPGFHLYGTDICLEARKRHMPCFAVSSFCIHNSNGLKRLPSEFWKSYRFLQSKWQDQLPVRTPCVTIHPSLHRMCWDILRGTLRLIRRREAPGRRVDHPDRLYAELVRASLL